MIPITLLKKLGSKEFVTIIEDSNMRRCSGKVNKVTFSDTIRYFINAISHYGTRAYKHIIQLQTYRIAGCMYNRTTVIKI